MDYGNNYRVSDEEVKVKKLGTKLMSEYKKEGSSGDQVSSPTVKCYK